MPQTINQLSTKNLLVPAFGTCAVAEVSLPGNGSYKVDLSQLTIDDAPFQAQGVTLDYSNGASGTTCVFAIERSLFSRTVKAGQFATFNFPSLGQPLVISATPSDGVSAVKLIFANWPVFPDQTPSDGIASVETLVTASDGTQFSPDDYSQTWTYNTDNTPATVSVTVGTNTYTRTFTYTAGNATTISNWVKV